MLGDSGGVWWCSETLSRDFREQSPQRKILGPKKHLDWLKMDLIATKIITVQDYKCTKNFARKFSRGPWVQERVLQGLHIYENKKIAASSP